MTVKSQEAQQKKRGFRCDGRRGRELRSVEITRVAPQAIRAEPSAWRR